MCIAIVTLIALLLFDLIVGAYFLFFPPMPEYVTNIGPLFVGVAALVALLTLRINLDRNDSEDRKRNSQNYLKSATEFLEKAFETLADLDDKQLPKNNRLNWLSAARLIKASEKMQTLITEDSHKIIYGEQKAYWRARFYDLLMPNNRDGFPEDYYAQEPAHMIMYIDDGKVRPPLSEKSLAVLYRFIQWPEGSTDPLLGIPKFTSEEMGKMELLGPRSLASFLNKVEQLTSTNSNDKGN
ncbi:MAG: hypothetical protein ACLP29_08895 [Dissulfurispiraceae bacterium]